MPRRSTLSVAEARRIALAAQGFADPRPTGPVTRRHFRKVLEQLGAVQIDSVNVLVRTQYLPFFSRLGPYDRGLLDRHVYEDLGAFEYWGHMASLVHSELHPLFRWRMTGEHQWQEIRRWAVEGREYIDAVHAEVLANGPLTARDLDGSDGKKGPWWGWGDTKRSLEALFYTGRVGAVRRGNFERAYCDPTNVIPADVLAQSTPAAKDAMVALLELSARGHGIGTAVDLADYFRLPIKTVRPLLEEMADAGLLERVQVEGWKHPAFLHPKARLPRAVDACALVSPFDSIMWERSRVERLFGFKYQIEIYLPPPKRTFGYYVLPFLLGDRYVGRVDLKAERSKSQLLVQSAFSEPGVDKPEVAARLQSELRAMADWLGLDDVVIKQRGDLARALRATITR